MLSACGVAAHYWCTYGHEFVLDVWVHDRGRKTIVAVEAPDRSKIESVFSAFKSALAASKVPASTDPGKGPVVFIGHARSEQWRLLGHTIRDILEQMADVTVALLVMTAEDEHVDGTIHARDKVIHEVGSFQGKLEYGRAIVLLEEGTTEFSNLAGIQQIRFANNNIRETYGDVLATLRREFAK